MNASFGWVLLIAVLTLVGLTISLHDLRIILSIWHTPLLTISALPPEGLVKVIGRAVQATTMSPISRTQCLVWKAKVVDVKEKGLSETLYKGSSMEPFEISDPTGILEIRPEGAELSLKHVRRDNSKWVESLGSESQQAMDRLGIDTRNWLKGNRNLEVSESYLSFENTIYILGTLKQSEGRPYIKTGRGPLIISDRTESELLFDLYTWVVLQLALTLLFGWVILYFVLR
jgi:hypothetical protein